MKQLIILAAFLANAGGFGSKPAAVPDHVTFDYQITQLSHDNQSGTTETITYYFTKDGSYTAASSKDLALVIYDKTGNTIAVDDRKKERNICV